MKTTTIIILAWTMLLFVSAVHAGTEDNHAVTTIDCPSEKFLIEAMDAALRATYQNHNNGGENSSTWDEATAAFYIQIVNARQKICDEAKQK